MTNCPICNRPLHYIRNAIPIIQCRGVDGKAHINWFGRDDNFHCLEIWDGYFLAGISPSSTRVRIASDIVYASELPDLEAALHYHRVYKKSLMFI
jgi:hypothetical protein